MTNGPQPLCIAVLGCGNIGSTFAFQLSRAGHDLTAVTRPGSDRLRQLRHDGAVVDVRGDRASVHVVEQLDGRVTYDLVIVTLLAHQVAAMVWPITEAQESGSATPATLPQPHHPGSRRLSQLRSS